MNGVVCLKGRKWNDWFSEGFWSGNVIWLMNLVDVICKLKVFV